MLPQKPCYHTKDLSVLETVLGPGEYHLKTFVSRTIISTWATAKIGGRQARQCEVAALATPSQYIYIAVNMAQWDPSKGHPMHCMALLGPLLHCTLHSEAFGFCEFP